MALVAEKGVLTAPTSTGVQTYSLGSAFNGIAPKVVILWATYDTAIPASLVNGDGIFSMGWGTNDGGSIQQTFTWFFDDDALGNPAHSKATDDDAILKGVQTVTTTPEYIATLDSFNSGTPSNFKLNWTDAPASAFKCHYLVLGGSDITAARAGLFNVPSATTPVDVTVVASWGQPDLLLFQTSGISTSGGGAGTGGAGLSIGAGKSSTDRIWSGHKQDDGATMIIGSEGMTTACMGFHQTNDVTHDGNADLASKASWPTDGFRLDIEDTLSSNQAVAYLALRGTFTATLGASATPSAGSPPQVQTLTGATSTTPKACLLWSGFQPDIGNQTTGTRLGQFTVGAFDGTNEGCASIVNEDGNTASIAGRDLTDTKSMRNIDAGNGPTLQGEADGSFSGGDAQLSWTTVDSGSIVYAYYVILAESAPATPRSFPWPQPVRRAAHQLVR